MKRTAFFIWIIVCLSLVLPVMGQTVVEQICPSIGIQRATASFEPSGIVVTSFDSSSLWVYDIIRATRYPLPDTVPCTSNCRLSPDATWLTYFNGEDNTISMMRLNGTGRRPLVRRAIDVEWWSYDKLLVWTTIKEAYIQVVDDPTIREELEVESVLKVQPAGYWALRYLQVADDFQYQLVNLHDPSQFVPLTLNRPYLNDASWSPDGRWLAYVGEGAFDASAGVSGGEIFAISPETQKIEQWTYLSANYGAVRINGHDLSGLSWSPDGKKLAFWVMELFGTNMESNIGQATIHVLDIETKQIRTYCGYGTDEHTPNPPSLAWSPDSTHLAFAGNIPGDNKGYLLLAMDIETGNLTEFSDGVFPNYGAPNVIAWGKRP
jgi:WD40 repeat protein